MSFQIFISFSSHNLCEATEVRQALENAGFRCWMASRDIPPAERWGDAIMRAIEQSQATVVVLSPHSIESEQVYRELEASDRVGLRLIPLRLEDLSLPGGYGYFLNSIQWVDAFPPPRERHLARLIAAIEWIRANGKRPDAPGRTLAQQAASLSPSRWWESLVHSPDAQRATLALAEHMIRTGQTSVRLDDLPAAVQRGAQILCDVGVARLESPYCDGGQQYVVFAGVQLRHALACWVAAEVEKPDFDPRPGLASFPLLAEGLAEYIHDAWSSGGRELLLRLVRLSERAIEDVLARLVVERAGDGAFRGELFARLPLDSELPALRGIARAGQQLMEARSWEAAGDVFRRLADWLHQAPASGDINRDRLLAEISNEQGRLLRRQGELDAAVGQFRRTIDLAESLGDELLTGIATNNLAGALLEQDASPGDRRREALGKLEQNIERLRGCDATRHLAVTYHQLGKAHRELNPRAAEEYYRQDVLLCRGLRDDLALADALDTLASFLTDQQRYQEAEQTHQEELALFQRVFDLQRHARALANQGRVCLRQGLLGDRAALDRGCRHLEQSCHWYSSLDVPEEYAPALENLGRGHFLEGDEGRCRQRLEQAVTQYRRIRGGEEIARQINAELEQLRNR